MLKSKTVQELKKTLSRYKNAGIAVSGGIDSLTMLEVFAEVLKDDNNKAEKNQHEEISSCIYKNDTNIITDVNKDINNQSTEDIDTSNSRPSKSQISSDNFIKHKNTHSIKCATVNHNLRPESKSECAYIKRTSESLNINCDILNWTPPPQAKNIQHRARTARYNLLLDWCYTNKIKTLITAHHLDDQVETFLIRQKKNSGEYGLACMQEKRYFHFLDTPNTENLIFKINTITLERPFLNTYKSEIEKYPRKFNFVKDPSNENEKFDRVKARKYLNSKDNSSINKQKYEDIISQIERYKKIRREIDKKTNLLIDEVIIHEKYIAINTSKLGELNKNNFVHFKRLVTKLVKFINLSRTNINKKYTDSHIEDKHINIIFNIKHDKIHETKHCIFYKKKDHLYIYSDHLKPKSNTNQSNENLNTMTFVSTNKFKAHENDKKKPLIKDSKKEIDIKYTNTNQKNHLKIKPKTYRKEILSSPKIEPKLHLNYIEKIKTQF